MAEAFLLLKLLGILALMVFLLSRRWDVGVVMALGATLLGALSGQPLAVWVKALAGAMVAPSTIRLLAAVLLITTLGDLLHGIASLDRLVKALGEIFPDRRVSLPIIPALIGLLPMPGGALLSAPMVDAASKDLPLSPEDKTFFNYWFRHIWEYVFPLYPALLLVSAITGLSLRSIMFGQSPLTLGAVLAGSLWLKRRLPRPIWAQAAANPGFHAWRELAIALWPVIAVIVVSIGLGVELPITLAGVILLIIAVHRPSMDTVKHAFKRGFSWRLALLITGVMGFKKMIELTGAAVATYQVLSAAHFPPVLLAFLVPLFTGVFTGVTAAAMGIAFPLLQPIIHSNGAMLNVAAMAFGGGFIGVLLSPFHLCLVLTREYFNARWGPIYRMLAFSVTVLGAVAWGLYFLL